MSASSQVAQEAAAQFRQNFDALRAEIGKVVVGAESVVEAVLTCLLCGGHALVEGVPGVGKTLLVRTLAECLRLKFSRIQATPDLMPADITGGTVFAETDSGPPQLQFRPGPIFAQVVLADEINRATPKTQSAMLEAMQELAVTVGGKRHQIEPPFMVLATQNPLEMEGTYPLPEAQLDRFFFKIKVPFPGREEIAGILERTTGQLRPTVSPVLGAADILAMQGTVRQVPVADAVRDYAIGLVLDTHPERAQSPEITRQHVRYGASPRGVQALILGGKVRALLDGRFALARADIDAHLRKALRHRLVLNFEGEAAGLSPEDVLDKIKQGSK